MPTSPDEFSTLPDNWLGVWKRAALKLVWLTIPIEKSALVPIAVSAGFFFHRCSENQITLVNRLIDDAFVPSDATHFIGAGAVGLKSSTVDGFGSHASQFEVYFP